MKFSTFTTAAALFMISAAVPLAQNGPDDGESEPVCSKGLYSNPQCCTTDVLGVANLDCKTPLFSKQVVLRRGKKRNAAQSLWLVRVFFAQTRYRPGIIREEATQGGSIRGEEAQMDPDQSAPVVSIAPRNAATLTFLVLLASTAAILPRLGILVISEPAVQQQGRQQNVAYFRWPAKIFFAAKLCPEATKEERKNVELEPSHARGALPIPYHNVAALTSLVFLASTARLLVQTVAREV
ncbi:hypothetical protein TWF696_001913 [Orbilia brochopaga]|uniref:Uncharacterized protein n=1 Tax=Orbilia brochopaga TaxID=3140254 RepID=A0AAV9U649_9PEZI